MITFAAPPNPFAIAAETLAGTRAGAWRVLARPEQLPPEGPWSSWYVCGGRGAGKTWTGANTLAEMTQTEPIGEWGIVAPTYGDGRDKCVEGPSGILAAFGTNRVQVDRGASRLVQTWNRSLGEMRLRNGSSIYVDGADDGALRIQGYNLRGVWADEVGLWKQWQIAWEQSIQFAVRLQPARIVATGTPKRGHPLVRRLMKDAAVVKTLLRTMDNVANLDPETLARWLAQYEGTELGRQELGGEVLEDAEGALWKRDLITYRAIPPRMVQGNDEPWLKRTIVSVDPSATATGDECGIIGVAKGHDGFGYVLDDVSTKGSPTTWATAAVALYRKLGAGEMLVEDNQGGEMTELAIHTVDPNVHVKRVHAARSKYDRAAPVAALYEHTERNPDGRIFHAKPLPELEDQLCNWDPAVSKDSPDRMDALTHGLTSLMLTGGWAGGGSAGGIA